MIGVVTLASLFVATFAAGPGPAGWWARARTGGPGGAVDAAKSYLHSRADVNQLRLDRLIASLEKVEAEYKKLGGDDHEVDHLETRIEKLAGDSCKKRQFQCGGSIPQCISNLLVCDGSRDCDNGHDEDEDVCVNLVPEGSSWSWTADWGNCVTSEAKTGHMLVTSTSRSQYFASRVKLGLTITTDDDAHDSDTYDHALSTDGFWSFGGRKLVINPGTAGFPATVCKFEKGEDRHCEGPLVKADTWEKCGTITATRHN